MMIEQALRSMIREELRAVIGELREVERAPAAHAEPLTVKEAAAIARVTEKTIRNWLAAKELTTFHAGRQLRVDRRELASFMATGPKPTTGEMTPEQLAIQHLRK